MSIISPIIFIHRESILFLPKKSFDLYIYLIWFRLFFFFESIQYVLDTKYITMDIFIILLQVQYNFVIEWMSSIKKLNRIKAFVWRGISVFTQILKKKSIKESNR